MTWKKKLFKLAKHIESSALLPNCSKQDQHFTFARGIHLAIFSEPFLSLLIQGKKTVESRFTLNKYSPFEKIFANDLIFIKKTGGPIIGYFIAGNTTFYYAPSKSEIEKIKTKYSERICSTAVPDFWNSRKKASYISLIEVCHLYTMPPVFIDKKDRTSWVVIELSNSVQSTIFD